MELTTQFDDSGHADIISRLKGRAGLTRGATFPFSDFTQFLCRLICWQAHSRTRLVVAGPIRPDVEIAADRAEQPISIVKGASPFSYDFGRLLESLSAADTIFYLANPNRVTGANMNESEISELIDANRGNLCIIDEYYFDHCGITALETVETTNNVIILRSFNSSFDNRTNSAGYAIGSGETIEQLGRHLTDSQLSLAARRTMMAVSSDQLFSLSKIKKHHDESLRLASNLNTLGIQCRLAPADFILFRVADAAAISTALNRHGMIVEDLSDDADLENYLRYELRTPRQNDELIATLQELPQATYRMKRSDTRATAIKRSGETNNNAGTAGNDKSRRVGIWQHE